MLRTPLREETLEGAEPFAANRLLPGSGGPTPVTKKKKSNVNAEKGSDQNISEPPHPKRIGK
jgi:hypothetical protein